MLKKITSIKNVGRFRNSAAPGNPQLAKHTLIAGANGFGKTTLCAVLRSLKTGDPSHIIGRKTLGVTDAAIVEFLLDDGTAKFDGREWSTTHPTVEIFDGVFVAENVHSGEVVDIEHKRNFYRVIVGEKGANLASQDTELARQSREKTSELAGVAKAIQPHIPSEMKLDAFMALRNEEEVDRLITEQQKAVGACREASTIKARPLLSELAVPALPNDLADILTQTIEDIAKDAELLVADHLAAHRMPEDGGNWIARGLDHSDNDTCPFCGQGVQGLPLLAAYRVIFGERYKALTAAIAAAQSTIDSAFGEAALARIETVAEQNKGNAEFWQRHCAIDVWAITYPSAIANALRNLGHASCDLLKRKSREPLNLVPLDATFAAALAEYGTAKTQIETINAAIVSANAIIAEKKTKTEAVDLKAAENELARLSATRTRHSEAIVPLCTEYGQLATTKNEIDKQRATIRKSLDDHTQSVVKPYQDRINDFLDVFNAGFRIAETRHSYPGGYATSTYQLVVNNTAIEVGDGKTPNSKPSFKNTLSSGDRTTLALAFFLAHLERDSSLAAKTVVFDDPFNSQDAFRRRQTVHEIIKMSISCAQVIVLSHDATFLKQIWDKAPTAERIALTIADQRALGSKLLLFNLDRATQGRTANDIDDLQTYLSSGAGNLLDIIRKIRVVLETYCRTTYPSEFSADDWLGDIVRKTRDGGESHPARALYEELDQLNEYSKQYHHGEDVGDATPDQIDPTELSGYVRRTLKIANALQA